MDISCVKCTRRTPSLNIRHANKMQQLKSYNHGFRYILNVIDIFSKFLWSIYITDKTGTLTNAFQYIVKTSKGNLKCYGFIMDLNSITMFLKDGWLRMVLNCTVSTMKARLLLLEDSYHPLDLPPVYFPNTWRSVS